MDQDAEYINEHYLKFEQLLKQFVEIRSVSNTDDDMSACINFLKTTFEKFLHAKVTLIKTAGLPSLVAQISGKTDHTVLFYGHYDTMPGGDRELWKTDPFKLTLKNARYFGRGVGDNKGQLMAQILGIYTYIQLHGTLPFNVTFLVEGEEERGSVNLKTTVSNLHETLLKQVELAVVVDGSINQNGEHVIRLGNRGLFGFELTTKTGENDNHSGNAGNIMTSAAIKLVTVLKKLYDFDEQRVLIPDFYQGVPQGKEIKTDLLEALPYDRKQISSQMGLKTIPDKMEFYQRLMYQPTFNIAGINGGYTGKGLKTVIPHQANVKIDCRLVGNQNIETIREGLETVLATEIQSGRVSINYLGAIPPSTSDLSKSLIDTFAAIIKKATGSVVIEPVMAGTVPNYVWTEVLKVPVVTIPYANYDQHNHAPNENMTKKDFMDGIKISYELAKNLFK
ncbi:M20/M25/M40 family metallo-hydrolase [Pediococcus cellicola]|uniref:Peptidase M20 n=1 Tax=Pediococcus cellicola TaxID=319652 RepID=A0A0R2IJK4_9LACO|nr:M20/M25/M40 family metallo-hydrolase [Pediococcus cellicola]KRN65218.1 peptidase M20 [Pediococcus cellicola]GEL15401.1 peptidase M20 [Pediococcus cellicola]